jgi:hypothetical protein
LAGEDSEIDKYEVVLYYYRMIDFKITIPTSILDARVPLTLAAGSGDISLPEEKEI